MRKITALLMGIVALVAITGATLATTGNEAQAHASCTGISHWHQHWPAHRDYWHDHGTYMRDGNTYRSYHIHSHDSYRETRCT